MFSFISEALLLLKLMIIGPNKPGKCLYILELDHFPVGRFLGMTWFGWLVIRRGRELKYPEDKYLYNHEKIHLDQAREIGSWSKFYYIYLLEWIKAGFRYRENPLEKEAFLHQKENYYAGGFWKTYKEK